MKPPRRPPSNSGRPGSARPGSGTGSGRSSPDRASGPRPSTPRHGEAPRGGGERAARVAQDSSPRRDDTTLRAKPRSDRPVADRPVADSPASDRPTSQRPGPGRKRPERGEAERQGSEREGKGRRDDRAEPARPSRTPRHAEPHGRAAGPREAPGNSLWIYGLHAVAAALGNPARHLRRLLLTEEAEAAVATRLKRPWALSVERTDRSRLDHLLGPGAIHQGAALLVEPLAPPSLQSAVARPGPILVLDQVTDPRNVGAILRAAAAFGVAAVITQDRNAPEETGALAKAASGALEVVPFLRAVNIARTLVALRAAGFWVVGLDAGGGVLSGRALAQRRVALVLGNEGEGLRRLTRDTCDEVAGIAMPGASAQLESLNVSAAAAVALYELARS